MSLNCIVTLSLISKLIAGGSIFTHINWLHVASLTLLFNICILGNILMVLNRENLLTAQCDMTEDRLWVANLIGHIILPLLIGLVMYIIHGGKTFQQSYRVYAKSCLFCCLLVAVYFIAMQCDLVNTYGLPVQTQIYYGFAWIGLTYMLCPLSICLLYAN